MSRYYTDQEALTKAQECLIQTEDLVKATGDIIQDLFPAEDPRQELQDWIDIAKQMMQQTREMYYALKRVQDGWKDWPDEG